MTYEDLASLSVSAEFGHNGRGTEVRSQREVRDRARGKSDQSQMVEQPRALRSL